MATVWASGDHDYAPLHEVPEGTDLRIRARAACGARFTPAAIWARDLTNDASGIQFIENHACKRCLARFDGRKRAPVRFVVQGIVVDTTTGRSDRTIQERARACAVMYMGQQVYVVRPGDAVTAAEAGVPNIEDTP